MSTQPKAQTTSTTHDARDPHVAHVGVRCPHCLMLQFVTYRTTSLLGKREVGGETTCACGESFKFTIKTQFVARTTVKP